MGKSKQSGLGNEFVNDIRNTKNEFISELSGLLNSMDSGEKQIEQTAQHVRKTEEKAAGEIRDGAQSIADANAQGAKQIKQSSKEQLEAIAYMKKQDELLKKMVSSAGIQDEVVKGKKRYANNLSEVNRILAKVAKESIQIERDLNSATSTSINTLLKNKTVDTKKLATLQDEISNIGGKKKYDKSRIEGALKDVEQVLKLSEMLPEAQSEFERLNFDNIISSNDLKKMNEFIMIAKNYGKMVKAYQASNENLRQYAEKDIFPQLYTDADVMNLWNGNQTDPNNVTKGLQQKIDDIVNITNNIISQGQEKVIDNIKKLKKQASSISTDEENALFGQTFEQFVNDYGGKRHLVHQRSNSNTSSIASSSTKVLSDQMIENVVKSTEEEMQQQFSQAVSVATKTLKGNKGTVYNPTMQKIISALLGLMDNPDIEALSKISGDDVEKITGIQIDQKLLERLQTWVSTRQDGLQSLVKNIVQMRQDNARAAEQIVNSTIGDNGVSFPQTHTKTDDFQRRLHIYTEANKLQDAGDLDDYDGSDWKYSKDSLEKTAKYVIDIQNKISQTTDSRLLDDLNKDLEYAQIGFVGLYDTINEVFDYKLDKPRQVKGFVRDLYSSIASDDVKTEYDRIKQEHLAEIYKKQQITPLPSTEQPTVEAKSVEEVAQAEEELVKLTDEFGQEINANNSKLLQGTKLIEEKTQGVIKLYHNSNKIFDAFTLDGSGKNQGKSLGNGIYLATNNQEYNQAAYGKFQTEYYAKVKNPLIKNPIYRMGEQAFEDFEFNGFSDDIIDTLINNFGSEMSGAMKSSVKRKLASGGSFFQGLDQLGEPKGLSSSDILQSLGYDSVISGTEVCIFNPQDIVRANDIIRALDGTVLSLEEATKQSKELETATERIKEQYEKINNHKLDESSTKEQFQQHISMLQELLPLMEQYSNMMDGKNDFHYYNGDGQYQNIDRTRIPESIENYQQVMNNRFPTLPQFEQKRQKNYYHNSPYIFDKFDSEKMQNGTFRKAAYVATDNTSFSDESYGRYQTQWKLLIDEETEIFQTYVTNLTEKQISILEEMFGSVNAYKPELQSGTDTLRAIEYLANNNNVDLNNVLSRLGFKGAAVGNEIAIFDINNLERANDIVYDIEKKCELSKDEINSIINTQKQSALPPQAQSQAQSNSPVEPVESVEEKRQLVQATEEQANAEEHVVKEVNVEIEARNKLTDQIETEKKTLQEIETLQSKNDSDFEKLQQKKDNYAKYGLMDEKKNVIDSDKIDTAISALRKFNPELEKRNQFEEKYLQLLKLVQASFVGDYSINRYSSLDEFTVLPDVKQLQNMYNNGIKGVSTKEINGLFRTIFNRLKMDVNETLGWIQSGDINSAPVIKTLEEEEAQLIKTRQELYDQYQEQTGVISRLRQQEMNSMFNSGKKETTMSNSTPSIPLPQFEQEPSGQLTMEVGLEEAYDKARLAAIQAEEDKKKAIAETNDVIEGQIELVDYLAEVEQKRQLAESQKNTNLPSQAQSNPPVEPVELVEEKKQLVTTTEEQAQAEEKVAESAKVASDEAMKMSKAIVNNLGSNSRKTIESVAIEIDGVLAKLQQVNDYAQTNSFVDEDGFIAVTGVFDELDLFAEAQFQAPPNYNSIIKKISEDSIIAQKELSGVYDDYFRLVDFIRKSKITNIKDFKEEAGDNYNLYRNAIGASSLVNNGGSNINAVLSQIEGAPTDAIQEGDTEGNAFIRLAEYLIDTRDKLITKVGETLVGEGQLDYIKGVINGTEEIIQVEEKSAEVVQQSEKKKQDSIKETEKKTKKTFDYLQNSVAATLEVEEKLKKIRDNSDTIPKGNARIEVTTSADNKTITGGTITYDDDQLKKRITETYELKEIEEDNVQLVKVKNHYIDDGIARTKQEQKELEKTNTFLSRQQTLLKNIQSLYDKKVNPNTKKGLNNEDDLNVLRNMAQNIQTTISNNLGTVITSDFKDNLISNLSDLERQRKSFTDKEYGATELSPSELNISKDIMTNKYDTQIAKLKLAGEYTSELAQKMQDVRIMIDNIEDSAGITKVSEELKKFKTEFDKITVNQKLENSQSQNIKSSITTALSELNRDIPLKSKLDYKVGIEVANQTDTQTLETTTERIASNWALINTYVSAGIPEVEEYKQQIEQISNLQTSIEVDTHNNVIDALEVRATRITNKLISLSNQKFTANKKELNGTADADTKNKISEIDQERKIHLQSLLAIEQKGIDIESHKQKLVADYNAKQQSLNEIIVKQEEGKRQKAIQIDETYKNLLGDFSNLQSKSDRLNESVADSLQGTTKYINSITTAFGRQSTAADKAITSFDKLTKMQGKGEITQEQFDIGKTQYDKAILSSQSSQKGYQDAKNTIAVRAFQEAVSAADAYQKKIEGINQLLSSEDKSPTFVNKQIKELNRLELKVNETQEVYTNLVQESNRDQSLMSKIDINKNNAKDTKEQADTFIKAEEAAKSEKEAIESLQNKVKEYASVFKSLLSDMGNGKDSIFKYDLKTFNTVFSELQNKKDSIEKLFSDVNVDNVISKQFKENKFDMIRQALSSLEAEGQKIEVFKQNLNKDGFITQESTEKLQYFTDKLITLKETLLSVQSPEELRDFIKTYKKYTSDFNTQVPDIANNNKVVNLQSQIDQIQTYDLSTKTLKGDFAELQAVVDKFNQTKASANGDKKIISEAELEFLRQAEPLISKIQKAASGKGVLQTDTMFGDVKDIDSLKTAMSEYAKQQGYINGVTKSTNLSTGEVTQTWRTAKGTLVELKGTMDQTCGGLRTMEKEMGQVVTLGGSFKSTFATIGRTFIMAFSGYRLISMVRTQLRNGINTLKEYDTAMTTMSYTMNLSQEQFNNLGSSAVQMANDLNTSLQDAMSVYQIYANMSATAESINKQASPTLVLSNLAGMSAEEAATDIQSVLNQFNLLDEETEHIVDVYDKISANIKVDYAKGIGGIADAVKAAGQTAYEAGLSFEQLSAIVARTMEKTRDEGAAVGNALRTMMVRTSKASKLSGADEVDNETLSNASKALHNVGVEVYNADGSFREFDVIMEELAERFDSLTDAEKNNIAYQVAA